MEACLSCKDLPSPKSFTALCIYIEATSVRAGPPRLKRQDAASFPTVCLINDPATRSIDEPIKEKFPYVLTDEHYPC